MEKIFFKLKVNIPNIDTYMANSDPCTLIYLSELIIDEKDGKVSVKIFYPDKEYLGRKISQWFSNSENNLLRHFEAIETVSLDELVAIDFTGFKCIGISNGSNDYEQFNSNEPPLKFTVITITGIRMKYNDLSDKPSQFYLNSAGFPLVEMNYQYAGKLPWEDKPYTFEPDNKVEDFIKFDRIEFKPDHNFYNTTKYDTSLVSIQKEPRLLVKHENLSEEEIRKQALMLCALLSFYANTDVEYFVAKTYTNDGRFYERRKEKKVTSSGHGIFMWDFHLNPLNLITNVNAGHLMDNHDFVMNTIKRFNYAMQLSGESKFMILYNILEQIRVQYILEKKIEQDKAGDPPKLKKVIQEYEFTQSKNQTDKAIKEALEKVAEIVKEEQKEDFKEEISAKTKNIKLMSMANQFKSLFDYTNMEPSICNLDFDKVKKLRNDIFHGNPVDEEQTEYIERISSYDRFPRFVGIMILKYFGIDDVKKVERKYHGK